jgi:hypothetical protein
VRASLEGDNDLWHGGGRMDESTGRPRLSNVARDEGPTAGTCCGVLGTLPGIDRR